MKRMRSQATEWEKIFEKDIFERGLLLKIYKEFKTQQLENEQPDF